jgi:alkylglycerol monooxygenase
METFASAVQYVVPIFLLLIIVELLVAKYRKMEVLQNMDVVSSLSSGLTNALFKILGVTVYLFSYDFLSKYIAFFHLESIWMQYVTAFFVADFYIYWWHRWRHKYNVLWNEHVIHHSSESYNLPVALRQTMADFFNPATILLAPAAILGVSVDVLTVVGIVMLFGGFWYHTQLIGKMGFLEQILVTPSHHRIHHAINPEYIDKNFGGILILWDKLFGTFQEELEHIKPVYGITRPVRTWNPIKINFQHITLLAKDAWRTSNTWDKFRIWLMPTGWRPADVEEQYPVPSVKDVKKMEKYMPPASLYLKIWSWVQLIITTILMMHLIQQLTVIPKTAVLVYATFIFLSVYSYSALMDQSRNAWHIEVLRIVSALAIINFYNGWFMLDDLIPRGTSILSTYLVFSLVISLAFEYFEFKTADQSVELSD